MIKVTLSKTNSKVFWLVVSILLAGFGQVSAEQGAYKSSKHGDPVIGVQRDLDAPRGNCSQCHIQHDGDLPIDFGLFAPDDNLLCQSAGCHLYEYQWPPGDYYWSYPGDTYSWFSSAHGASTDLFPPGMGREVRLCIQCHDPHCVADSIVGIYPSATNHLEERGCYSNSGTPGDGCHGSNEAVRPFGSPDIYSMILKTSKHAVESSSKTHSSDWSSSFPYGRESRIINSGDFSGANRHVECVDCHNPHFAVPGAHEPGFNNIGGPLLGSWGVEPQNGLAWTVPTSFSSVDFTSINTSSEYQLCFKCHSYFAFGETPPTGYTDIAQEFNPANMSYHPVEDYIPENSYTSPSANNGFIETMEPPWDNGIHDLMTCSDCHGSDVSSDPAGPHGSNQPYILKGSPSTNDNSLCLICHKQSVYAPVMQPGFGNETGSRFDHQSTGNSQASHWYHVTQRGIGCRQCHASRVTSPGGQVPGQIEPGAAHGTNIATGFVSGTEINSYTPGRCYPTCHGEETYTPGPE